MKRCPNCSQVFSDDNFFCLNDGTTLEVFSSPAANDSPTQVLSSFPTTAAHGKTDGGYFYLIIGAMAVVIVGLSAIVFFLLSDKGDPANAKTENKREIGNTVENKSVQTETNSQTEKPDKQIILKTPPPVQTPPITAEAVDNLIDRWKKAQNARNFNAYKSCYSETFFGIKRTKTGGESRMNYGQWLNDRRQMLKNTISVEAQNPELTIEDDTATVRFVQQFQSVNYQDTGQKTLKIKMFPDGAKIIYEELKYVF